MLISDAKNMNIKPERQFGPYLIISESTGKFLIWHWGLKKFEAHYFLLAK
jgi:hypothetical protein